MWTVAERVARVRAALAAAGYTPLRMEPTAEGGLTLCLAGGGRVTVDPAGISVEGVPPVADLLAQRGLLAEAPVAAPDPVEMALSLAGEAVYRVTPCANGLGRVYWLSSGGVVTCAPAGTTLAGEGAAALEARLLAQGGWPPAREVGVSAIDEEEIDRVVELDGGQALWLKDGQVTFRRHGSALPPVDALTDALAARLAKAGFEVLKRGDFARGTGRVLFLAEGPLVMIPASLEPFAQGPGCEAVAALLEGRA